MRERSVGLVATIATSLTIACSDAAVENFTAPPIAATPASPVTNEFPTVEELLASGASASALGLQITVSPYFVPDYRTFVVDGTIRFQASNEVSATVSGWLINQNGQKINEGSAGFGMTRFGLPVPYGDSTVQIRIVSNNITCGLTGKSSYKGFANVRAVGVVPLFTFTIEPTNGRDVLQPVCPPPPPPPPDECDGPANRVIGGASGILASVSGDCDDAPSAPSGSDPVEVCYIVWRQLWTYDLITKQLKLVAQWPIGVQCYQV